jgi:hypothetical protein
MTLTRERGVLELDPGSRKSPGSHRFPSGPMMLHWSFVRWLTKRRVANRTEQSGTRARGRRRHAINKIARSQTEWP